jgi:hypothetical protein
MTPPTIHLEVQPYYRACMEIWKKDCDIRLSQGWVAYPSSGNHGRMADNGTGGRWIWRKGTYIFCEDEYVGNITQKFKTKELGVNWSDERELGTVVCTP